MAPKREVIEYLAQLRHSARLHEVGQNHIERWSNYAARLLERGYPVIFDTKHLAHLVGYDISYLNGAAYDTGKFYRSFEVAKKSGGTRRIDEPLPSLKEIQRWLLDFVLLNAQVSRFAKGFIKNRSILDNARFHKAQPRILSMDIKDFFPSIHRNRVEVVFHAMGYSDKLSHFMARLTTLNSTLPQGAPTSPAISNAVARRIDARLAAFAVKNHLRYTRYADDITISGDFRPGRVIHFVERVLNDDGFELHEGKIRVLEPHERQQVTGIVVNSKLQASRNRRRTVRQSAYYIKKFGLADHMEHVGIEKANYVRHLMGHVNFVLFVNRDDQEASKTLSLLRELLPKA